MSVLVMVDVETNGDCPPVDSMLSLGAAVVEQAPRVFYAEFRPLCEHWTDKQLETVPIHKITPEAAATFQSPEYGIREFLRWLDALAAPVRFLADTGGFDWTFTHYYLKTFGGRDPFGYSGRDVRALWMGYANGKGDKRKFGDLRPRGSHTHNALDDARGNAVAALKMLELGIKL